MSRLFKVGTARCAVRAAFSGATSLVERPIATVRQRGIPPALRAVTAQRAVPTTSPNCCAPNPAPKAFGVRGGAEQNPQVPLASEDASFRQVPGNAETAVGPNSSIVRGSERESAPTNSRLIGPLIRLNQPVKPSADLTTASNYQFPNLNLLAPGVGLLSSIHFTLHSKEAEQAGATHHERQLTLQRSCRAVASQRRRVNVSTF